MAEYVITVEADRAPEILLGQKLFGGKVTALNLGKRKLVSASELAKKYGLSNTTVRTKLATINQGTCGKHLANIYTIQKWQMPCSPRAHAPITVEKTE